MTKNVIFLLCAAIALVSCQKQDIDKLDSNTLTATSNATPFGAFSGTLKYFYKGSTNNNIYFGNSTDGFNFTSTVLNNGAATQGSPAATQFGSNIYVFHRGANNFLYRTYSANGGSSWSSDSPLGNSAATAGDISACTYGGKMFVAYASKDFHLGNNSTNIYISSSSDGNTWTEVVLPYMTYVDPYIFTFGGSMYIMYADVPTTFTARGPLLSMLSSTDGIHWDNLGSPFNGFTRFSVATSDVNPNDGAIACVIGIDNSGQLQTKISYDLLDWTVRTDVKVASSGALAYSSRRPSVCYIGYGNFEVVYKAKTNDNIIWAANKGSLTTPDYYDFTERGNANGQTPESPYLIWIK